MTHKSYIVVYNPISKEGHLDSWHALFIELLANAGCRLIAVSSDPAGLIKKLSLREVAPSADLLILDTNVSHADRKSRLRQLWKNWNDFCNKQKFKNHQNQVILFNHQINITIGGIGQKIIEGLHACSEKMHRLYMALNSKDSMKSTDSDKAHINPAYFIERINQITEQYPNQIGAVFNMYLDVYRPDKTSWLDLQIPQNIPLMGLCIKPNLETREGYYYLPTYQGTCFLDESITKHYQSTQSGYSFEFIPDITFTHLPDKPSAQCQHIAQLANGRQIVFMGGSIGRQKNLVRWYELIKLADAKKWFFVQIGKIQLNDLSEVDSDALKNAMKHQPENLYMKNEYINDERLFNEIINLSHVIFAVYRDFSQSSNMITKAAYFKKPILVASGLLMSERVRRYKIGIAVDQDSIPEMLAGLAAIDQMQNIEEHFAAYQNDFSMAAVQNKLLNFFGLLDKNTQRITNLTPPPQHARL